FYGEAGNDTLIGGNQNDLLYGGDGNDTITDTGGTDSIDGGAGNDTLNGSYGDDTIQGGTGADTMDGGYDNDTYYVDNVGDIVNESADGIDSVYASVSFSLVSASAENLYLSGSALDGTGNGLNNIIVGTDAANTLEGN